MESKDTNIRTKVEELLRIDVCAASLNTAIAASEAAPAVPAVPAVPAESAESAESAASRGNYDGVLESNRHEDDDGSMDEDEEIHDKDDGGDGKEYYGGAAAAQGVQEAKKGKGRRGDPRMHRAVAARLAKPQLSLFQALVAGGFKFPVNEMASKGNGPIYDSDNVLLSQRKNQLSRRLRLLARRRQSHQMALNASAAASQTGMSLEKSNKIVSAIEANNTLLFGYPAPTAAATMQFPATFATGVYPGMNTIQQQIQMQSLLQQDMVRSSAATLRLNQLNHAANPTFIANQFGYAGMQLTPATKLAGVNVIATAAPAAPMPTAAYLTSAPPATQPTTATTVPPPPSNPESTPQLATTPTPTTPSPSTPSPSTPTPTTTTYQGKLDQAISFYKSQKEALKKQALIAAGFDENEIQAVSDEYQRKLTEDENKEEEENMNGENNEVSSTC